MDSCLFFRRLAVGALLAISGFGQGHPLYAQSAGQIANPVAARPEFVINTSSSLPPAFVGVPYLQSLTATGGAPPYSWTVLSGSLPAGITLSPNGTIAGTPTAAGTSLISVQASDNAGTTQSEQLSLVVNPPPVVVVSPTSLSFVYHRDGVAIPSQSISLFNGSAIPFSATTSTPGGNWLSLSAASGTTPATFVVSVDPAGLNAGVYSGQIAITIGSAAPTVVPVTITVTDTQPGVLQVAPSTLNISLVQGGVPGIQQLVVSNVGGGTLTFNAQSATQSGGNWITLQSTSGAATFGAPGVVPFTVGSANLTPGTYTGSVTVSTGSQKATALVILSIRAPSPALLLSRTGLQFTTVANTTNPPAQAFSISNPGQSAVNWTASASTLAGGSGWLSVSPSTGSTQPAPAIPSSAVASINAQNLPAGTYYGSISVQSPDAPNSPQVLAVQLNVLAAGEALPPSVSTNGILLTAVSGGDNPAPQSVSIYSPLPQSASYIATSLTYDGGAWFSFQPETAALGIQSILSLWPMGIRHGTMRAAFADGSVQTIDVLSVVAPPETPVQSAARIARAEDSTAGCPSKLILQSSAPGPAFSVTAAQSVPITVLIVDDCTHVYTNASRPTVVASFYDLSKPVGTRAQADIALTYQSPGVWAGTWTPQSVTSQMQVVVTAVGEVGVIPVAGQISLSGPVRGAGAGAPALASEIYNAASFQPGNTIASGSFISIFGTNLGNGSSSPTVSPLPTQFGGAKVMLGNTPLPLQYVGPNQINALVPTSIPTNTTQQLIVQRDSTQAAALSVSLADSQPGIYTVNQQGSGQGAVLTSDNVLAAPTGGAFAGAHPATRGSNIQVFATGLGPVMNAPPDGAPAPSSPLASTLRNVTATIGGVSAPVLFSGLAPGFVGLYQVNVTVPPTAPAGDAIALVLTQDNVSSNPVTIAIQ
jgi:uncharacterized protein (TIGR03437 family)